MKKLDVTGEKYGRLTAIEPLQKLGKKTVWVFVCACGVVKSLQLEKVRDGRVSSCGCLRKELTAARSITHGNSVGRKQSRELKSYNHAKSRCCNPNDEKFPRYGGRGITMREPWLNDAERFISDMGPCPPGHTLDRLEPNGHYEPGNCRWATSHQQARTRTDNVFVEFHGQKIILKDYASLTGLNYKTLHARMKYRGMSLEDASSLKPP